MKKNNIRILAFTMTLCVSTILSARASNAADTQQANKVTSNSLISEEQAYDSSDTSSSNLTAEAYCDNSASDGINLKVIRDKNGDIEKLVETEAQELERYVK